jgi:hypothetical protein
LLQTSQGTLRWTLRLLENKVMELGIVDRASDSTIGRTLKKTLSSPIAASNGSCPERGTGAALVLPACNTEAMQLHLDEIATKITPGAHAILILDQAGWHGAKDLKSPSNISLLPLPPRAPELNSQENIWQFMRQNWLSNRIFKSFDDIVDHCCFAWNTLIDQPWKIMSIAHRDWAVVGHSL